MDRKGSNKGPHINPPLRDSTEGPDYLRECAFAVEPSLITVIEAAVEAGWSRKKTLLAIMIAAGDYFQAMGLEFDSEDIVVIGPKPDDVLN